MNKTSQSHYTQEQIIAWLRGLLTIAWADGHFDPEEQELMAKLTQEELSPAIDLGKLEPITPEDLAQALGEDENIKENFLRTAVMMAIANGIYTTKEAEIVHQFHDALGLNVQALQELEKSLYQVSDNGLDVLKAPHENEHSLTVLHPVKEWLDNMDVHDPRVARFICKMVPPQCPFERDIVLFGHKLVHIPAMCKLNPLYEQLVGLRFRSLSYLADDCQEDISKYI